MQSNNHGYLFYRQGIGEAYAGVQQTSNLLSSEVQRRFIYKEDVLIHPGEHYLVIYPGLMTICFILNF